MYAFPRRSVGTRKESIPKTPATSIPLALLIPPLALLRAAPLPRLLPLKGGEIYFSLFPCSRVGTRSGQRNVCIPTQERGNEKRACQTPATSIPLALLIPPLALLRAAPLPRLLPPRGERFISPCSHAPAWEQEAVSVMYAFPRRSVGTRKTDNINHLHSGLVDPPSGTAAGCALAAPSPPKGGEIYFSLFPCSRVGTRSGQRNVCIPTQERGNEKN